MPRPSHPPCFDHSNNTRRKVQTMQLLIMQFSCSIQICMYYFLPTRVTFLAHYNLFRFIILSVLSVLYKSHSSSSCGILNYPHLGLLHFSKVKIFSRALFSSIKFIITNTFILKLHKKLISSPTTRHSQSRGSHARPLVVFWEMSTQSS
jgi:hypothetical protein